VSFVISFSEATGLYKTCWREPWEDSPDWADRAFVDVDGAVYLPVLIPADAEKQVSARACQDRVFVVPDSGRSYFPIWWLIREYPGTRRYPVHD
jgi:hypothetical protein